MGIRNLFTKQKLNHRYSKQTYGYQVDRGGILIGRWGLIYRFTIYIK